MVTLSRNILLTALGMLLFTSSVCATGTHQTRSYVKKNGQYVKPHKQTNPNKTERDNWGTAGNINLSTGKKGTKKPHKASATP